LRGWLDWDTNLHITVTLTALHQHSTSAHCTALMHTLLNLEDHLEQPHDLLGVVPQLWTIQQPEQTI
jgi:hypothetical protein